MSDSQCLSNFITFCQLIFVHLWLTTKLISVAYSLVTTHQNCFPLTLLKFFRGMTQFKNKTKNKQQWWTTLWGILLSTQRNGTFNTESKELLTCYSFWFVAFLRRWTSVSQSQPCVPAQFSASNCARDVFHYSPWFLAAVAGDDLTQHDPALHLAPPQPSFGGCPGWRPAA